MGRILVLSLMNFSEAQLDKLRAVSPRLEVQQIAEAAFDELPQRVRAETEILYGWSGAVREAHHFPRLKWLQTHSAGIDYLTADPLWQQEQIAITSLNGVHAVPMAEYTLAVMLGFRWRLPHMLRLQDKQTWVKDRWKTFIFPELRGSTLGIVGYGAVGRELARQAQALGVEILAVNHSGRRSPYRGFSEPGLGDPTATIPTEIFATTALLHMLPQCDYVVILAPLTPETHHLFGAEAFAAMKDSAFLVNLARGGLVDEAALIEALQNGQIAGAGLDVFETEPLPSDSPLWNLDNVIISPHVAGFTTLYDDRATDLFAENLRRYLHQESLLNLVEREKGY
jgi:phosphoglycerate dehydrogenase-like enzyme